MVGMTFDEIDARYRAAVLTAEADGDEWDDPETETDDDEGELGYRNTDEEATHDEAGGQEEDA
jgi:hypothetical protein